MRIIIKEEQFKNLKLSITEDTHEGKKSSIFKYWDKYGPELGSDFYGLFSINPLDSDNQRTLTEWLFEWHGGISNVLEKFKSVEHKIFEINSCGTFKFKFELVDPVLVKYEQQSESPRIFIEANVDGKGTVILDAWEQKIRNAILDEDSGWQIKDELENCIMEFVKKQLKISPLLWVIDNIFITQISW
jgi:hypothetical protein